MATYAPHCNARQLVANPKLAGRHRLRLLMLSRPAMVVRECDAGWRCCTCHPPDHLLLAQSRRCRT